MSGCDVQLWMFSLWETSIATVRTEPYRIMPKNMLYCRVGDGRILVVQVNMRANACVNHLENECVQWLTCHNWKGGCSTMSFLVNCNHNYWNNLLQKYSMMNCCCWWVVWKLKWICAPKTMHCFRAFSTAGSTVHFTLSSVLHYHITEVPNFLRRFLIDFG